MRLRSSASAARPTPTPMPALVPVERDEELSLCPALDTNEVVEAGNDNDGEVDEASNDDNNDDAVWKSVLCNRTCIEYALRPKLVSVCICTGVADEYTTTVFGLCSPSLVHE